MNILNFVQQLTYSCNKTKGLQKITISIYVRSTQWQIQGTPGTH